MASDQPDINKLRRRLLKAAAGAPVIFTLPVGTGVAAASIACDAKPGNVISAPDATAEEGRTFSFRPDPGRDPFLDGSAPQRANETNLHESRPDQFLLSQEREYVELDDGSLITASCWTSLNPTATNLTTLRNNRIF